MYVGVVCVVDDGAAIDSFFHFQSHGDRFEFRHSFAEIVDGNLCAKDQYSNETGYTVFDGSIIDKHKCVTALLAFIFEVYSGLLSALLNLQYVQVYAFDVLWKERSTTCNSAALAVDNYLLAVLEQQHFF